ncbi:uncharacterized protein N7496_004223 [Penicillium cataractarum]|uniref:Xylanolytic transcriptional activator regulatory domain-containing protein n=1 Tax=Penicillium cataractarum TaxID=2100454 RepID=A0A9W9SPJ0_9EURO|nr:uncharacterized protein N7496_004223 [Penicillium cataractarum]KAJ5381795.1 hypothetical protein N7496_004223 [Penicillium cataractarum]
MALYYMSRDIQSARASETAHGCTDVLRRHERTCKSRGQHPETSIETVPDQRDVKRKRLSQSSGSTSCALGQAEPPVEDLPSERHVEDYSYALFDDMLGLPDGASVNMPSPLDFSALDFLLFPRISSDTFAAEKLEYMAYFTSARGMSTFTDRPSFLRRQKMAAEAYDKKLLHEENSQPTQSLLGKDDSGALTETDSDRLASKSREIVDSIRSISSSKRKEDSITVEWSPIALERCLKFFSPPNIRRFLAYFWSLWYPHCPIVHKPLFDASSASPSLLCVMLIIGACLSPRERDMEDAREWMDTAEELVFSHECFRGEAIAGQVTKLCMKEKVQCLQASYMVCSLQKREGSAEAQARSRRHRHASMVALTRSIGPKTASHRHLSYEEMSDGWWRDFVEKEELIRTMTFIFLMDAALTILHNSPPRMVVSELKMDVACPESCFQAESAQECNKNLRTWAVTRFWKKRISVVSVVRRVCQSIIDDDLVQEYSFIGTFNLFTMVQAIHSLMFHLHNSLVFESTLAPVQTGLENWRRIWCERVPEDLGLPDTPENLWKQVGFLRQASEFWQLARIMADEIMSTTNGCEDENDEEEERSKALSRYDHTDMGDVNGLIMQYRRLNLGVS